MILRAKGAVTATKSKLGSSIRPRPSRTTNVVSNIASSEESSRWWCAHERQHFGDQLADADLIERLVVVLRDEPRDLAFELGEVDVARTARCCEQRVDGERHVVVDDRDEQVRELVAADLRHRSDPPEVGEGHSAVGQREQIARMRVGVIEAVHEDLLEVGVDATLRELGSGPHRTRRAGRGG